MAALMDHEGTPFLHALWQRRFRPVVVGLGTVPTSAGSAVDLLPPAAAPSQRYL